MQTEAHKHSCKQFNMVQTATRLSADQEAPTLDQPAFGAFRFFETSYTVVMRLKKTNAASYVHVQSALDSGAFPC